MTSTDKPNIVLQPSLGRMNGNYKPNDSIGGYLALAKVIKIHHKHNTVDLQIVKTNNSITSTEENEGRFGARVAVSSAHFNRELMSSSGVVEPILEGQLVILAFLDGLKNEPIVLGSFHETWTMEHNVMTDKYPLRPKEDMDDFRESQKYLRVTPSQFYHRIDGIGAVEMSHPSRSFMIIDPDFKDIITDGHTTFDHNDLSEKDPYTGKVRSARLEESLRPVKMLFVHRSSFDDADTTWSKFILNQSGSWRITRDNHDDTLSYTEMSEEGKHTYRRQMDSSEHGEGEKYSEIIVDVDGSTKVSRVIEGKSTSIEIDKDNNIILKHESGSYFKMSENGDIIIDASNNVVIRGSNILLNEG